MGLASTAPRPRGVLTKPLAPIVAATRLELNSITAWKEVEAQRTARLQTEWLRVEQAEKRLRKLRGEMEDAKQDVTNVEEARRLFVEGNYEVLPRLSRRSGVAEELEEEFYREARRMLEAQLKARLRWPFAIPLSGSYKETGHKSRLTSRQLAKYQCTVERCQAIRPAERPRQLDGPKARAVLVKAADAARLHALTVRSNFSAGAPRQRGRLRVAVSIFPHDGAVDARRDHVDGDKAGDKAAGALRTADEVVLRVVQRV